MTNIYKSPIEREAGIRNTGRVEKSLINAIICFLFIKNNGYKNDKDV
jgi:hypothetical protein